MNHLGNEKGQFKQEAGYNAKTRAYFIGLLQGLNKITCEGQSVHCPRHKFSRNINLLGLP